jgi:hypothetical protein
MLVSTIIKVHVVSGSICLILLIICNSMPTASAAQSNNNNTDPVLKAIQEALPTDSRYLKAKVTVKDFELNADVLITSELMSKGLAIKNQLKENESILLFYYLI